MAIVKKIHHWKLDDDYLDSVGTADGTEYGTVNFVPALFGSGIVAPSGTIPRIECGNPTSLQFTTEPFTFSLWFRTSAPADQNFFSKFDFSTNRSYVLRIITTGVIRFHISTTGSDDAYIESSGSYADGKIHHVAITRSGAVQRLYVDGVLDAETTSGATTFYNSTANFAIANYVNLDYGFKDGWIDNLEVWNYALTLNEIKNIVYDTQLDPPFHRRVNVVDNTAGLWRLDESGGGTPVDLGPLIHDATNSGTTAANVSADSMPFAYARDFDRSTRQYIYVPHHADFNLTTSVITAMCWVKIDSFDTGGIMFMSKWDLATGGFGWMLYVDSSFKLVGAVKKPDPLTLKHVEIYTRLPLDEWIHLAFVNSGSNMYIYINGKVMATLSGTNGIGNNSQSIVFGRYILADTHDMDGKMADITIIKRKLEAWEIYNTWAAVAYPQDGLRL